MQSTNTPESTSPFLSKIEGWPYSITIDGKLYSHQSNRFIKTFKQNRGYWLAHLRANNQRKTMLVHRLVALAFIPNPDELPEVNHKDGDKDNNHASNLEWSTHADNIDHAYKNRLHRGAAKLSDEKVIAMRRLMRHGMSPSQLSRLMCMDLGHVCQIRRGDIFRHVRESSV